VGAQCGAGGQPKFQIGCHSDTYEVVLLAIREMMDEFGTTVATVLEFVGVGMYLG